MQTRVRDQTAGVGMRASCARAVARSWWRHGPYPQAARLVELLLPDNRSMSRAVAARGGCDSPRHQRLHDTACFDNYCAA
jgi:hypothetical protein